MRAPGAMSSESSSSMYSPSASSHYAHWTTDAARRVRLFCATGHEGIHDWRRVNGDVARAKCQHSPVCACDRVECHVHKSSTCSRLVGEWADAWRWSRARTARAQQHPCTCACAAHRRSAQREFCTRVRGRGSQAGLFDVRDGGRRGEREKEENLMRLTERPLGAVWDRGAHGDELP